jgi:hypothetical protein
MLKLLKKLIFNLEKEIYFSKLENFVDDVVRSLVNTILLSLLYL